MRYVTSAFIAILLSSIVPFATAQSWWQQPPTDDSAYLYGLGEGYTVSQAQVDALKNIGGKLGTTVAAQMQRYTHDTGNMSSDEIEQRVSSQINDIELGFYEVLKTASRGDFERVLVRLDKQRLAQQWRGQITRNKQQLLPLLKHPIESLSAFAVLSENRALARDTDRLSLQLAALENSEVPPSLLTALDGVRADAQLRVQLQGNVPLVNDALRALLFRQNISLCERNCRNAIVMDYRLDRQQMFGKYVAIIDLTLQVLEQQQVVKTVNWRHQVSSILGQSEADQAVLKVTSKQLKQRGLWQSLGYENATKG